MKKDIVMIHGWGTRGYNGNLDSEKVRDGLAWEHRSKLVKLLEDEGFNLKFFNLPGFYSVSEPKKDFFDIEDFSDYFSDWLKDNGVEPLAIIGYSFGGVVALDYKVRYKSSTPIILTSPALKRKETLKSYLASFGKYFIPAKYLNKLKHIYQSMFSRYYQQGTPFLRASYDKIVRRDIRPLLNRVNKEEMLLIYGDSDESTPAQFVMDLINQLHLHHHIIKGGDHDIGETHPQEVFSAIDQFLNNCSKNK